MTLPPISWWTCYSNFITCPPDRGEHLLRVKKTDYELDLRRVAGHAFLVCHECNPPCFFFAVLTSTPDSYATCYLISKESYRQWARDPSNETKSTPEMLYLLRDPQGNSLNPNWRPLK